MFHKKGIKLYNSFDFFNYFLMLSACFITLYPFWFVIVNSFNDGTDGLRGGIYWWPRVFTLENYRVVFINPDIVSSFKISVLRTVIATFLAVFFTAMVAYAFSKKWLIGKKFYMAVGTITLFFGGGLIPYFILLKKLGFLDHFIIFILPTMFNFYNLIIFQAFFREIPSDIEESAKIDGANDILIFLKIIIPLSTPVLATIALFIGVYNWNDFFFGVLFINNPKLLPIQTILYKVISETSAGQMLSSVFLPTTVSAKRVTSTSVKLATMMVATVPILCVYPFVQKYFVKGIMLGSVKG